MLRERLEVYSWLVSLYFGEPLLFTNVESGEYVKVTTSDGNVVIRKFDAEGVPLKMEIVPKKDFNEVLRVLADFVQEI